VKTEGHIVFCILHKERMNGQKVIIFDPEMGFLSQNPPKETMKKDDKKIIKSLLKLLKKEKSKPSK
jgi:hypothetical protein